MKTFYLSAIAAALLAMGGCKKEETPPANNTNNNPGPSPSSWYIKFNDGATVIELKHGAGGLSSWPIGAWSGNYYLEGTSLMDSNFVKDDYFMIGFGKDFGFTPTTAQIDSMYLPGTYTDFGVLGSVGQTLIQVNYTDAAGNSWESGDGTNQTGSKVTITSRKALSDPNARWEVTGTFNCILYDTAGVQKTITNGMFVSKIGS
jgi:hypothetical protein